ncbi:hypothetical protein BURK_005142 [Burkholderia sp. SJ98]|nr:hypothetical protein BURK_005142 [Burkholderia sp. SJ98]
MSTVSLVIHTNDLLEKAPAPLEIGPSGDARLLLTGDAALLHPECNGMTRSIHSTAWRRPRLSAPHLKAATTSGLEMQITSR